MSCTAVGAYSAHLPDDDARPISEVLADEITGPGREPRHRAKPTPVPPTAEMAAVRPVPRPKHLAHPDSPVGRINRRGPVDHLDGLLTRPLDTWSDLQLQELTGRLLAAQHARRARWAALRPPTGYGREAS